jgi:hypothetical protein
MQRRALLLAGAAAGFALFLVAAPQGRAAPSPDEAGTSTETACSHAVFSRAPSWTGSGTWNGDELLLVDTVNANIIRYSTAGKVLGELSPALANSLQNTSPFKVAGLSAAVDGVGPRNGRIVVQVQGNRFLSLDPSYSFINAVDARSRVSVARGDSSAIEKVLTWTLAWSKTSGYDLFGFAEIQDTGNRWSGSVVRMGLDSTISSANGSFENLKDLPVNSLSRKFHRLGFHYVAAVGETGYIILMDDEDPASGNRIMTLYSQEKGQLLQKLQGSFGPLGDVPDLPGFSQPVDFAPVMRAVEQSAMITGIYAWGRDLYVLSRRPGAGATTEWRLTRIAVNNGSLVLGKTSVIKTHAPHLFAVPGDRQWAFVEKAEPKALALQEVTGVLYVPSERIASLAPKLCN